MPTSGSATRASTRVGLALLLAGGMWFYVQRIVIPYQERDAQLHSRPRGNLSDLYPRWLGTRELLLHGRDPYSPEVTREIQVGFYGRPLDPSLPNDPKDQQGFAYPVYVALLLSPIITLPFPVVQTAFLWLLVVLTAVSVFLWLAFLQWRPSGATATILLALTLGSFAVVQGFKLQQLSLLVGFFIALSAGLLARGHLFSAGTFAAIAMIKPQLALPFAGWLLLWSCSDWRKRRSWVLGFGLTMAVLLAASEWLLPGWISRFRDAVVDYRAYAVGSGVLETLFTPAGGKLLNALLISVVVVLCWRSRRFSETQPEFQRITSLVLAVTVVIIPMIVPYNHVLLLPAIFIAAREWASLRSGNRIARALSTVAAVLIAWPWFAAAALTALAVVLPAEQVQRGWSVPLFSLLFIPLSVVAMQLAGLAARDPDKPRSA